MSWKDNLTGREINQFVVDAFRDNCNISIQSRNYTWVNITFLSSRYWFSVNYEIYVLCCYSSQNHSLSLNFNVSNVLAKFNFVWQNKAILGQIILARFRQAKEPRSMLDLQCKLFVMCHCNSWKRMSWSIVNLLSCHEKLDIWAALFTAQHYTFSYWFEAKSFWVDNHIVLPRLYEVELECSVILNLCRC